MKDQHSYTDKASYIDSDIRWLLELDGQNVQVFCDGESRRYCIPNTKADTVTEMKVEDEYVQIFTKGGNYFQFKFEVDKFLVGDIFSKDGEHLDCFACHTFGED